MSGSPSSAAGIASARPVRVGHLVYCRILGGSEAVAAEICRGLDSRSYAASVVSMVDGPGVLPRYLEEKGVAFHRLRNFGFRRRLNPLYLAAKLRRLRFDVLHVHHVPLFADVYRAARLAGVSVIGCTEHAKLSISRSAILQNEVRRAAHVADFFVTVSEDLKRYFVDDLSVRPESIEVIPNGVDVGLFHPGAAPSDVGNDADGRRLITVGRLTEAKDHSNLIAAVDLLRQAGESVQLVIVGDGELRASLEAEIARRNLGAFVTLAGARTDPQRFLREADIFVLSSAREGFPVVILEAMASGLAVVSTDVGGISEVLKTDENGLLVRPGDPAALAAAVRRLLSDSALRSSLGTRARETVVNRFSLRSSVERYEKLYEGALAGRVR
ncbi:MAG TPA: glycosyltransferase [Candidatus Polarisedimenticolaceae bacterium]|nr:glycosyltransferase [Candidatus Polarisedimenticolaceae bacterium]